MSNKLFISAALCAAFLVMNNAATRASGDSNLPNLTQYVNPFIGTGGHGHVFLGANVPFGNIQIGPTEQTRGWDWCSGYHYSDSLLVGFSHTHMSGTGIGDLGDITFMPTFDANQRLYKFSHNNEQARPGYYAVTLTDNAIRVELSATRRAGIQRYTFPANGADALVKVDMKTGIGWDKMTAGNIKQESANVVSGYRMSSGWAKDQKVYFAAVFSHPVTLSRADGDSIAYFSLGKNPGTVTVKVGLSAVSVDNAKLNLMTEIPGMDLDRVAAAADAAWNEQLDRINVTTSDRNLKTVFYTALFHTMTAPSVYGDVNGDYRGSDKQVHHGNFTNYTTFSLWDTYRAAQPLMTLIHPDMAGDIAQTWLHIFKEGGKLPVWHFAANETDCMVGNPGIIAMGDLVLKGFVKDKEAAFRAMKASAMLDERGLDLLKKYGYLPWDKDSTYETVAKGLEYAIADAAIAKVAKVLGHEDDYKYFYNRSQSYKKYFDKKSKFMRGVSADGKFREPFNPFHSTHRTDDYTEGNAWQYTWLVPHDVPGLIKLFGGAKPFAAKLDSLFIVSGDLGAEASPDISGLIGQYAHGNEPSHHVLYMYNYINQQWKAAPMLRDVMYNQYRNDFDGLSGNEDVGQMSAWFVLSSIGLYQVDPADGPFMFGSPVVDKAVLNVGGGRKFTIIAHNNSKANMYVQSVKLNGKPYKHNNISYADIVKGGTLEFFMGPKAKK